MRHQRYLSICMRNFNKGKKVGAKRNFNQDIELLNVYPCLPEVDKSWKMILMGMYNKRNCVLTFDLTDCKNWLITQD